MFGKPVPVQNVRQGARYTLTRQERRHVQNVRQGARYKSGSVAAVDAFSGNGDGVMRMERFVVINPQPKVFKDGHLV